MTSDLLTYVSKLLPDATRSDHISTENRKKDSNAAVIELVIAKVPQLLALDAKNDVEGVFSLLITLILQVPAPEKKFSELLQLVKDNEHNANAVLRLRLLAMVFNKTTRLLPDVQFQALLNLLALAVSSDNMQLLNPYLTQMETIMDMQKLSVDDRRMLYLTVANVLEKSEDKVKALLMLEKYLATYETGQINKEQALRACQMMLQDPVASVVARVDFASLVVVKTSLEGEKIYELLEIVSTKTLKEFISFHTNACNVFTENGLQETEIADTMRLFTLCSLPTGFQEISYADVAKALDVEEENVEKWVVRAITAGLVNAKIDQLARTVTILCSLQRRFGNEQWKEIDTKLQLYKKNVGSLLDIIKNARRA